MPFLWCSYFLSESAIWTPNTVEVNGSAGLHKTGLCFHYSPSSPPHTIRLFRHTLIVLHWVAGETQSQEEWDWVRLTNGCLLSLERQQLKHNRKGKAESRDAWMPPWCPGFKFRLGHFSALKTRVFSWLGSMWYLYNKVFFIFKYWCDELFGFGFELWLVTQKGTRQIQASKMSFLSILAGLSLR